ncbi:hypothetical protein AN218_18535 [Streptomyces nanshensis]|uniref:HTH gntR-type domain-containing protein n=2 Tax=Streptomyces nanshensis TaxID=518642 RepID=A0A1E7L286_9ACTN|nr:hypothetical protein AN218_18535 [Streptomyces nanshensis]
MSSDESEPQPTQRADEPVPLPPAQRVVDWVEEQVRLGLLSPHEKLPSTRQLAVEIGVAPNTVSRALGALRTRGVIYSHQGSGSFISEGAADAVADRLAQALRRLDEVERNLADMSSRLDRLESKGEGVSG